MAILKSVTITVETGDGMHISLYATSSEGNPRFMNHELRKAITVEIPTGYQDETGFHMGAKPAEKVVQWPPVW